MASGAHRLVQASVLGRKQEPVELLAGLGPQARTERRLLGER